MLEWLLGVSAIIPESGSMNLYLLVQSKSAIDHWGGRLVFLSGHDRAD